MPRSSAPPSSTLKLTAYLAALGCLQPSVRRSTDFMNMKASVTVDGLNATLGHRWEHGTVTSVTAERVGSAYGFSGTVHRLHVQTDSGRHWLIAKTEGAERIRRACDFRTRYEDQLP